MVALGALSSFCSLSTVKQVVIGTGISVGLQVYQGLEDSTYVTDKQRAQQLLGGLRDELIHPILLRKLQ